MIRTILEILISLTVGFGIGYLIFSRPISDSREHYINRIDSLESEILLLQEKKDTTDTIYIQLENNNRRYEETTNTIITNSVNENYLFFTDYINRNKFRLDSLINSIKYEKVN